MCWTLKTASLHILIAEEHRVPITCPINRWTLDANCLCLTFLRVLLHFCAAVRLVDECRKTREALCMFGKASACSRRTAWSTRARKAIRVLLIRLGAAKLFEYAEEPFSDVKMVLQDAVELCVSLRGCYSMHSFALPRYCEPVLCAKYGGGIPTCMPVSLHRLNSLNFELRMFF